MALDFRHQKLPNGLNIIAECDEHAHTAAAGFFVSTGARDEPDKLMGVSHFLEHMAFKGTHRRTAEDVNREFDEIGAMYNAYTSHEQTVFYAHVLPELLPRSVDLMGDILRPALRQEDFEMEKNVILEEIGMYNDRPHWRLQDTLMKEYFGSHPMGFRILGTDQTVSELQCDQMKQYFESRYSADNIVVSAVGRLDFDSIVDQIEQLTQTWAPTGAQRQHDPIVFKPSRRTIRDDKLTRHYIGLLCPAPCAQDDRRYAARVLADVLGDVEGSRIYWALVDPGLADEADFSFIPQDQLGYNYAYASCDPDRAELVEQQLLETIDTVGTNLNPDEVDRAKNKLATSATLLGEQPRGRMSSLGTQWAYLGEYLPLDEELRRLMAVSIDDMHQLIDQMPFGPKSVVTLTPN